MSIKRNEGESFADFKERRISDNEQTRLALKPKLFWNSYYDGTYTNGERNEGFKRLVGSRQAKKMTKMDKRNGKANISKLNEKAQ